MTIWQSPTADRPVFTGFYFRLIFLADPLSLDAAFQEVSGLSKTINTEEVTCGGENRFKYRLPAIPSHENLVLKRGITTHFSMLRHWCSSTLDDGFSAPIKTRNLMLILLNSDHIPCMLWSIHKAYPVKWHTGELNAKTGEIMIETIELSFQYLETRVIDDSFTMSYKMILAAQAAGVTA